MSLQQTIDKYLVTRKQLTEQVLEELKKEFKKFFAENPGVKMITWTQYTPYFNDGEECVFSVNEIYFFSGTKNEIESEEVDCREDSELTIRPEGPLSFMKNEIESIPEEIMQDVFGNHAEIIVTPDNIEIREYEHD